MAETGNYPPESADSLIYSLLNVLLSVHLIHTYNKTKQKLKNKNKSKVEQTKGDKIINITFL